MGFESIEPSRRQTKVKPVQMGVQNNRMGHTVIVYLSSAVMQQMGFGEKDQVDVARGTGTDSGWLRLSLKPKGYRFRRPYPTSPSFCVRFKAWDGLPHSSRALEADFLPDVIDHALKIKLPFDLKVKR